MSNRFSKGGLGLVAGALGLVFGLAVQGAVAAEPESATFTVTATTRKGNDVPPVTKSDVQFFVEKKPAPIADWKRGEKLYLAVLIDDSLDSNVANQWNDLREFFAAMPPTTYIGVFYARNGSAVVAQDFTNDHALAGKALRLPLGNGGTFSSPYLTVQDLMKRWPDTTSNDRGSILMISSGIDYFRGGFEPITPDMDATVEHAQKQNINVWAIYAPDARHRSRGFSAYRGQINLSELTEETGGEAYYLSTTPLVSFKPYLDELYQHLNNQYLLTFQGDGGRKGRFERVREATELSNTELFSASSAYLPAGK